MCLKSCAVPFGRRRGGSSTDCIVYFAACAASTTRPAGHRPTFSLIHERAAQRVLADSTLTVRSLTANMLSGFFDTRLAVGVLQNTLAVTILTASVLSEFLHWTGLPAGKY